MISLDQYQRAKDYSGNLTLYLDDPLWIGTFSIGYDSVQFDQNLNALWTSLNPKLCFHTLNQFIQSKQDDLSNRSCFAATWFHLCPSEFAATTYWNSWGSLWSLISDFETSEGDDKLREVLSMTRTLLVTLRLRTHFTWIHQVAISLNICPRSYWNSAQLPRILVPSKLDCWLTSLFSGSCQMAWSSYLSSWTVSCTTFSLCLS